jgi:hypothetical protein
MDILAKSLDWQLFGLLFTKFGQLFFQSSGHPGDDKNQNGKNLFFCFYRPIFSLPTFYAQSSGMYYKNILTTLSDDCK